MGSVLRDTADIAAPRPSVDAEMGSVLRDTADIAAPRPSGICSGNIEKTSQNLSYNNMISVHNIGLEVHGSGHKYDVPLSISD
ncbi:hypothetical protein J6590_012946 [Homalodisca vitripennis]|nr:hypothetical protein J6590_093585 [Homalodisca vitripennis]KAG8322953.1 hypothetical protein J6590_012946 [Homalodisca vitripennis]